MSSTSRDITHFSIGLQSLFLFLLPKYHRVVSLLQTSSPYKCIYNHVCFCVHI
jgi:hypothetical protein